jgi:hypothetical protein
MIATVESITGCEVATSEVNPGWGAVAPLEPNTDPCGSRSAAAETREQAVRRRIAQRTWGRLRQLYLEVDEQRVLIRGSSPTYYLKQLALAAVQEVLPTMAVELDIRVAQSESTPLPVRAL